MNRKRFWTQARAQTARARLARHELRVILANGFRMGLFHAPHHDRDEPLEARFERAATAPDRDLLVVVAVQDDAAGTGAERRPAFGQIDLVIQLLFVIFLGLIGFSMAFESAKTTIKKYRTTSAIRTKLHQHSWIHGLPIKMRFHRSKLYFF